MEKNSGKRKALEPLHCEASSGGAYGQGESYGIMMDVESGLLW